MSYKGLTEHERIEMMTAAVADKRPVRTVSTRADIPAPPPVGIIIVMSDESLEDVTSAYLSDGVTLDLLDLHE